MEAGGVTAVRTAARAAQAHAALDASAPWLAHLASAPAVLAAADPITTLNDAAQAMHIRTARGLPLQFAPADDAGDRAYEAHIAATGRVPTRVGQAGALHDLLNALVWLALPATKAALNARQAHEIARAGVGGARGPVRDACTLLDESGLLLACADRAAFDATQRALATRDWSTLFVARRSDWHARIVPVVLGHALLEKLARPYKAITAQVLLLDSAECGTSLADIDARAAQRVQQDDLAPRALAPLPVLGVPGWWADNAVPSFYDDAQVFRSSRPAVASTNAAEPAALHCGVNDLKRAVQS